MVWYQEWDTRSSKTSYGFTMNHPVFAYIPTTWSNHPNPKDQFDVSALSYLGALETPPGRD